MKITIISQSTQDWRYSVTRAVPRLHRVRLGGRHGRPPQLATMSHGSWKDDEHYRDHFEEGERRLGGTESARAASLAERCPLTYRYTRYSAAALVLSYAAQTTRYVTSCTPS